MEISFSNLISPLSVEEFFQVYWEKKLLHLKRDQANFYDHILSIGDLDSYLQREDLSPLGMLLAVSGNDIDPRKWTKEERLLNGTVKTVVCPEKVLNNFYEGVTIIINSAQAGIPGLAEACRILEREFRFSFQSNIYITPPNSQGFARHYDPHDILTLQIRGRKSWRFYDTEESLPTKLRPFRKEPELVAEIQMQEGDLLYIPRGTVHEAFASESSTIHLNFSFKPRYGYHLLEDLAVIAELEDVFFRKTIPNGFAGEEERKKYIAEFAEKTLQLLEKHNSEALLDKQAERFIENQKFALQNRFAESLELENLSENSSVSRRAEIDFSIKNEPNGDLKIKFGRNELIIPRFIDAEIFLQNEPFTAKDIRGLITEKNKLEIIKEFLRKGFLKIVKI